MTVSNVSNNGLQQAWQTRMQQRQQDFDQLGTALQSGDLTAAQKAFADLKSLKANGQPQNGNSGSVAASGGSSDFAQFAALLQGNGDLASVLMNNDTGGSDTDSDPLSALASGLPSGNSTDLQTILSQLQSGMQGMQDKRQQRDQDFSQLGAALQSGDLAAAQQAFADLQSLRPGGQGSGATDTGTTTSGVTSATSGSNLANEFASLGEALKSGNLSDAQSAFAKLQSDMQAHRGRHHHHGGAAASYAAIGNQTPSTTGADSTSTINIAV